MNQTQRQTAQRAVEWQRLKNILEKVGSHGLRSLNESEINDLPGLYRKTLSDLSLLRTRGGSPIVVQDLSQLCNQAHSVIYRGTAKPAGKGFLYLVVHMLPCAVRRRAGYIWASAGLMILFAVIGWIHSEINPTYTKTVLSPAMVGGIETELRSAKQTADLGLAAQIPVEERGVMAAYITQNNIRIGVFAFIMGIAAGLPTLFMIAFNGYMLGVVAYVYFHTVPGIEINLPLYFISGVAPHGAIELPAICLAGAAGMLLGFSWLFPGHRPRGEALRHAVGDAGRLVLACAITLLAAGIIEGFITPLLPPTRLSLDAWMWVKCGMGAMIFILWLAWLLLGGRRSDITDTGAAGN